MKKIIILFILIFSSCNKKDKTRNLNELTYIMLIKENNKYNDFLIENIKNKIQNNKYNEKVIKYHNLTEEYLKFLNKIENELEQNSTEIFFENTSYSNLGKEFISITEKYKLEIEELVFHKNLRKRIDLVLNTEDIKAPENGTFVADNNESSINNGDEVYLNYLDYYFKEFSNNQALAFLNNKRKSILEIENEFIDSQIH